MGYWNTRGLRGSALEELINSTNENYKIKNLALIQKIPTSIVPVQLDKNNGTIKLAYFEQKSTVDYIGVVQSIPVCFDAKETTRTSIPLQNIHSHQIDFMEKFILQKGIAFLIVSFQKYSETYFLPFNILKKYWEDAKNGGRKSIPYSAFDKKYLINARGGFLIHYLEALDLFLSEG